LQSRAMAIGSISTLSQGEAEMCSAHSLTPRTLSRAWEYWSFRLAKIEAAMPRPGAEPAASGRRAAAPRRTKTPTRAAKPRPAKAPARARKGKRAARR